MSNFPFAETHITSPMMTVCMLLLAVCVLVSGRVATGARETVEHGAHAKHGKQDHDVDGHHNVHFDHEAILGSYKLEQEFDELPPEEAKKRLALLVKKMDKNQDMYVSKEELVDWILMSFRLLDEEDALEDLEEFDEDGNGRVTWTEYLKARYSYTPEEAAEFRKSSDESHLSIVEELDEDERKFELADVNKDGELDRKEFVAFSYPYNYEHMHDIELRRVLREHDSNKDNYLTLEEFLGENQRSQDKEWEIVEKERFADYDTNSDGRLDMEEMKPWVLSDNREEAEEEADHLLTTADQDKDGKLSEREIVDEHEAFVGSQATDYGHYLNFVKHKDEL